MKALILCVLYVVIGATVAVGIGWYVEREISSAVALLVFLALFFTNFVISWLAVVLTIDGTLKNAQGRQEQLDVEKAGRASISKRG